MKINLVLPHQLVFPPLRGGGVENLNWLLARQFARRGHEVVAYSRSVPELPNRETDDHGIRHIRVPGFNRRGNRCFDHLNAFRYSLNIRKVIEPADVTSFHTPFSFLIARKAELGICTHTLHRTPKWPLPLYRRLDRVYCGSDAVLAQARQIDRRISCLKRIHNCIDIPPAPSRPSRSAQKREILFLYVGRFVQDKGIESLVRGFELSLKSHPANQLVTIGPQSAADGADAHFFNRISKYVRKRGLGKSITFKKPVFAKKELTAIIQSSDVICVPSLGGETFSMAILEAMAHGKPVLVSDFSPMPESVDHLRTGYIAKAGDVNSICEAILYFSLNRQKLAGMGDAAYRKAADCFSAERIAAEYLEDFESLIARQNDRLKITKSQKWNFSGDTPHIQENSDR